MNLMKMNLTKVGVLKEIEKLGNTVKQSKTYSSSSVLKSLRDSWKSIKESTTDEQILKTLKDLQSFKILFAEESNHVNRIILGFEGKLNPYKDQYIVNKTGSELIYNSGFIKSQNYNRSKDIFDYKQFKETD